MQNNWPLHPIGWNHRWNDAQHLFNRSGNSPEWLRSLIFYDGFKFATRLVNIRLQVESESNSLLDKVSGCKGTVWHLLFFLSFTPGATLWTNTYSVLRRLTIGNYLSFKLKANYQNAAHRWPQCWALPTAFLGPEYFGWYRFAINIFNHCSTFSPHPNSLSTHILSLVTNLPPTSRMSIKAHHHKTSSLSSS